MLKLLKTDSTTQARRGILSTDHGDIQTPFFMPVGTNATVKSLSFEDLRSIRAQIVLSNTYHLNLRPGMDVIRTVGGLHEFMGWSKPTLTDSGGYQVFSLAKLRKLSDDGVVFQSHLSGESIEFTPEKVIEIENILGSDMIMPLDECAPYPCSRDVAEKSVERTTRWAIRSKDYFEANRIKKHRQFLFAIIQGATFEDLRQQSAKELVELDFDAYAIGGVSVGEPVDIMFKTLDWVMPLMPKDKPRYFMGIGLPDQIVQAVGEGIDMFDTCIPTRYGRHGTAFTYNGKIVLRNADCAFDTGPIDQDCQCRVCQMHTRAYIRHLLQSKETLGLNLVSYHNLHFYIQLMRDIRQAIEDNQYRSFRDNFLKRYGSPLYSAEVV